MEKLHRQLNTEDMTVLAPSEVEGSISLCSNSLSSLSTSLGGSHQLNQSEVQGSLKLASILRKIHTRIKNEKIVD